MLVLLLCWGVPSVGGSAPESSAASARLVLLGIQAAVGRRTRGEPTGFFRSVSALRVRRALAERYLVWPYSERLRLLVHAPIEDLTGAHRNDVTALNGHNNYYRGLRNH